MLGDAITSYDASLKAQIAEAVKALPASQPTEVKFGLPVPALDYSTISQFGTPQGNGSAELDNLAAAAEKAASSTASPVNSQVGKATLSVTPPTGVTIKTITYNGETVTNGQEINLAEGANFNVQFNVANDAAATSVDSSIDISLNGIKVASAPVNVEDAQKRQRRMELKYKRFLLPTNTLCL